MAVVKVTSGRRGVLFIDDDGNVFVTSVVFLRGVLDVLDPRKVVLLTRMPDRVSSSRFKKSPVYGVVGVGDSDSISRDGLSVSSRSDRVFGRSYVDKEVL